MSDAQPSQQLLQEFKFDVDDYFQSMEGTYWVVKEHVYNFDAYEYSYGRDGEFEITEEWDRRQYILTKLDYKSMCCETDRFSEHELIAYFQEATSKSE
ncbi:hypothetical protein [Natrinema soli]|uniref:Uncharacterized protein n=1 Tax=Natrinema soli TaxID=1930624 RepID=A0ABD5SNL0_9EURY|nr:hypothetical protein [Natrinema soli]